MNTKTTDTGFEKINNDNMSCGIEEKADIGVSARNLSVQAVVHSFISANILHRRAVEQWTRDVGMHRSQHRMLMYLYKCESTPSQKDLAKHLDISSAAVAVTLKKLESDGYIERGKCTEGGDSRFNEIKITDRGRFAVEQSKKYFQHIDAEALKDFSDEELDIFRAFLERMYENLKNIQPLRDEKAEKSKNS